MDDDSDDGSSDSSSQGATSIMGAAVAVIRSFAPNTASPTPSRSRKRSRSTSHDLCASKGINVIRTLMNRSLHGCGEHLAIWRWRAQANYMGVLRDARGCVNALSWSTDGRLLVSAGDDTVVRLHRFDREMDSEMGKLSCLCETAHNDNIFSAVLLDSDQYCVSSSRSQQVLLYCVRTGRLVREFGRDGSKLASRPRSQPTVFWTAGYGGLVKQHDLRVPAHRGAVVIGMASTADAHSGNASRHDHGVELCTIAASDEQDHRVAVGGDDAYARIFDVRAPGRPPVAMLAAPAHQEASCSLITGVALSPDGRSAAFSYSGGDVFVDDVLQAGGDSTGKASRLTGHTNRLTYKGVFFMDANTVASGSDDGLAYLWNLPSRSIIAKLHGDSHGAVNVVCVNPVQPLVATSGIEHTVKLWGPTSMRQRRRTRTSGSSRSGSGSDACDDEDSSEGSESDNAMNGESCAPNCYKRRCTSTRCSAARRTCNP